MGHIDQQIMPIRTTATPWNWTLPENDQDLTSQEKNSKEECKNNYVSNAHNRDTWPGTAPERTAPNHSTRKPGAGSQPRALPPGSLKTKSGKSMSSRSPNSRETKNVPIKRWSEGQTRMETHHHGKLLRGSPLHVNPQTQQ